MLDHILNATKPVLPLWLWSAFSLISPSHHIPISFCDLRITYPSLLPPYHFSIVLFSILLVNFSLRVSIFFCIFCYPRSSTVLFCLDCAYIHPFGQRSTWEGHSTLVEELFSDMTSKVSHQVVAFKHICIP